MWHRAAQPSGLESRGSARGAARVPRAAGRGSCGKQRTRSFVACGDLAGSAVSLVRNIHASWRRSLDLVGFRFVQDVSAHS
jgi:hypothetical protein